jgi:glycosyltransferase involved in cell wall biosynthesis
MNILTVTNCPLDPRLGSGTTVIRFTDGLRQLGHLVDILAPADYEPWPRVHSAKQLRQGLGAFRAIRQKLALRRYDVVELYGAEFWPTIAALARSNQRPLLVAHTNGLELLNYERETVYDPPQGLKTTASRATHRALFTLSFRHTDAFVSLCEADRAWVVAHNLYEPSMTAVVPPAPDETFRNLGEQAVQDKQDRVCFIGSWTARKGVRALSSVMNHVLRDNPQVVFDIFGASANRDAAMNSFDAAIRNRVQVHAPMAASALAAAVARAKVFFFPSQYEGYGLAVAEAMACGLAVVTTPIGLGAELVSGSEALICEFDDLEGMRGAITRLLKDEPTRSAIAANGRKRALNLRWSDSAAALSSAYLRWVGERAHRRGGNQAR